MLDAKSLTAAPGVEEPRAIGWALLVSTVFGAAQRTAHLGGEAYSYHFVQRAFAPLLHRLGDVIEVDRPESRLDYAVRNAQRKNLQPLHLSFRPLQHMYLGSLAPNVAFPFWEFPDIPNEDLDGNPRNNWVRIANCLDLILCASDFGRAAFIKAGVRTPVHVVPVPIRDEYFAVPAYQPGAGGRLVTAVYRFPREQPQSSPSRAAHSVSPLRRLHVVAQDALRSTLPAWLDRRIGLLGESLRRSWRTLRRDIRTPVPSVLSIDLSGIVYSSIFNPFDRRKNWQDLLSAFLLALREEADATLIVKLVVPPKLVPAGLQLVLDYYHGLGIAHRCQLAIVTSDLTDHQMLELTRLSTYYVTATRAEGACLPAQDFLAAGRPVVAPNHTAMSEYLSPACAFIVESHPEPTWWPHDQTQRIRTTWHRLVWQSLRDQIRASYEVARHDPDRYERMASLGRKRMFEFAGAEQVWPRLRTALSHVTHETTALR